MEPVITNSFTVTAVEDGNSAPFYERVWYAWSDVATTSSINTSPFTEPYSGWSLGVIPSNTQHKSYLWRKSVTSTLNADGQTYTDGPAQYVRLSGTNGTSIDIKGTVDAIRTTSGYPDPTVYSSFVCYDSDDIYTYYSGEWHADTAAYDGDAYIISKSCMYDGVDVKGHLFMFKDSNGLYGWYDLGLFQGEPGENATMWEVDLNGVERIDYTQDFAGVRTFVPASLNVSTWRTEGSTRTHYTTIPSGYGIWYTRYQGSAISLSVKLTTMTPASSDFMPATSVLFELCKEPTSGTKGDVLASRSVIINRVYQRMIYPAGEYTNKQYTRTDTATPLVLVRTENQGTYSNAYYYLVADNNGTLGSYISPTTPNQKCWQQATQYQVILADALMANFAKLASAVFYGDFMFSQHGDGGTNYQDFDPDDSLNEEGNHFRPNVLINWLTGAAYFENVIVEGTVKASLLYSKEKHVRDIDQTSGHYNIAPDDYAGLELKFLCKFSSKYDTTFTTSDGGVIYIKNE